MALVVNILQAVPAAGKTKAILGYVKSSKKPTIIASISCQLSQQSYDYYVGLGGTDAVVVDSDHVSRSSSVTEAIAECVGKHRVIFITHAALIRFPNYDDLEGHELFVDEVPDLIQLNQMKFTDYMGLLGQYCDMSNGTMVLLDEHRDAVEKIARDGLAGLDVVSTSLFELARSLLQGIPVLTKDDTVYFIDDNTTQKWTAFSKITIACANFYETFTGTILKEFCGWKFRNSELTKKLDFIHYPNTARVEIVPMFGGIWSRYSADKEIGGESVYNKVKASVYDITGMTPFIYTTNSYRGALKQGQRVAYNPHGLNNYMSHTTAVSLFSYNPTPWQIDLLKSLSQSRSMDQDKLMQSYIVSKYLEPTFQLCLRTDIRNQYSNWKVRLIVPDLRAAEYLKSRYLHEAIIDMDHMIEPPERKVRAAETAPRQKKKSFKNLFNFTDVELRKFYRYVKKENKKLDPLDPRDFMIVKSWIDSVRSL